MWRQSVRLIKILTLIQLAQLAQVTRADALLKKLEGYSTYTEVGIYIAHDIAKISLARPSFH